MINNSKYYWNLKAERGIEIKRGDLFFFFRTCHSRDRKQLGHAE